MPDDIPTCPSCGVPYADHLGLIGTCARVRELEAECDEALAKYADTLRDLLDQQADRVTWLDDLARCADARDAARAEVARLTAELAHAREQERAAVLSFLLRQPEDLARVFYESIERGGHHHQGDRP